MRMPGTVTETPTANPARETTLSADVNVTGTIAGQDLSVLGQFEGELRLSGQLRTGGASRVKAVVKAKAVEIEGEFEGEVRAESLRLSPTARAKGTFVAKRLVIEEGAMFHGAVNREPPVTASPIPPGNPAKSSASDGSKPSGEETPTVSASAAAV